MNRTKTLRTKMRSATFLLAVCLVLTQVICFDLATFANVSESPIYVSPDGDDDSEGSASQPLKTLKAAFEKLGELGGTVVVTGTLGAKDTDAWGCAYKELPPHSGLITITGKDPFTGELYPDAKIHYDTPVLKGPAKIEYLTLSPIRDYDFIDTAGQKFTMGKGLSKENFNIYVHDGISVEQKVTSVSSTETLVESGDIANFFIGGAYAASENHRVTGDCRFTMTNGKINTLYIGFDSYNSKHINSHIDGNVYLTLLGGSINKLSPAKLAGNKIGGFMSIIAAN
ncbi:MAG: hypothetical protein IKV97_01535, partial [Clostridia bacterium]|nr:hypothetical protein [Clostridia bacterium]